MNNKIAHMTYSSSLSSLCEINSSFDTGILRIAYTGKNRNGSSISKSVFEKCIETMYNCPVVCNYDRDTDSIGGHDMELVSNKDGDLKIVNCTMPVGVIPESSKYSWEIVEEDDGVEHEYLCAEVLIWKRQEAYQKIRNDGITSQSMEITIRDGEMKDGIFEIYDFEFTAFCLLGDDHEPCFESAAMGLFSLDSLKTQMEEMMSELKETYSLISPRSEVVDTYDIPTEGGEKVLDEKIALVAEYGYEIDALEFSIEELTLDELREKFEAMKTDAKAEPAVEPVAEKFELNSQICEEIRHAAEAEMVDRPWGKMPRYSVVDYDAASMMVYCFDADDHWKLYGFNFSMNGDNVVIDFDSKKRMKFAIVDFDDGDQNMSIDSIFEQISAQFTANDTQWSEKYQTASDTIETMNDELGSLRQFKADTEAAAAEVARGEIFARFEDLTGVEEFESLKEACSEFELAVLEEKCYAIRGRNSSVAKFAKKSDAPKLKVERTEPEDHLYGGLFEKYKPTV